MYNLCHLTALKMLTCFYLLQAMKVENMLKLKEEFDYKSLSRRLDIQLEKLIAEHERQQKAFENEIGRITIEAQNQISETERKYADALEVHVCIDIIFHESFASGLACLCGCGCGCVFCVYALHTCVLLRGRERGERIIIYSSIFCKY